MLQVSIATMHKWDEISSQGDGVESSVALTDYKAGARSLIAIGGTLMFMTPKLWDKKYFDRKVGIENKIKTLYHPVSLVGHHGLERRDVLSVDALVSST